MGFLLHSSILCTTVGVLIAETLTVGVTSRAAMFSHSVRSNIASTILKEISTLGMKKQTALTKDRQIHCDAIGIKFTNVNKADHVSQWVINRELVK